MERPGPVVTVLKHETPIKKRHKINNYTKNKTAERITKSIII